MRDFITALHRYFEPAALGIIALFVVLLAGGLIALDVVHAPAPQYRGATAAATAPPAPAKATVPEADRSVAKVEKVAGSHGDEKSDVTLFRRVSIDLDSRHLDVVTGLVYATSTSPKPLRQFCYLQAGRLSAMAEITVRLANKDGDADIAPAPLNDKDSRAVDLPLDRLEEAARSCRFV
jgi:hypothetical protein